MDKQTKQETVLTKRLLLLVLTYTFFRVLFLIIYYDSFQFLSPGQFILDFLQGLRFDLSAIIFTNGLFILFHLFPFPYFYRPGFQRFLKVLFYSFNIPALLLGCIDLVYFRYTNKRTTGDIFSYLSLGSDLKTLLPQYAKDFWYLLLLLVIVGFLIEFFYRKINVYTYSVLSKKQFIFRFIAALASIPVFVIGARGGLQYRPLSILNASQYSAPQNAPFILNTPFTFIKTMGKTDLTEVSYMPQEEAARLFSPEHKSPGYDSSKSNVVLIILEGIGKEFVGSLNNYQGYTPFLDSLILHSMVFPNAFANGKRSIEGIPAIIAGLPTLMNNAYITSAYAGNQINSIASVLRKKGYATSFFHGGNNGTMGFDIFASMAGFEHYYGRNEYNNDKDYDGSWGIYDEPFLQYFANSLNITRQPFFSCVFTLSSHHPYRLPEKYEEVFKGGTLPIHPTVRYTDYALKQFFTTASAMPWYKNTLFIITSDHTSLNERPFYNTTTGLYSIPILFYHPGNPFFRGKVNTVMQQADIMPTLLNWLKCGESYCAFGSNALDPDAFHFAINFLNDSYQLISGEHSIIFNGFKTTGLFNYPKDSTLSVNLADRDTHVREKLERHIKAIIQTYNRRMIHNQLTVKNQE
jgi:phosphoglycerol transferase MdoB-like AlkP superfamily enzyme